MNKTIFEKIILREIPATIHHEDDDLIIIDDINPVAPVHLLIIPENRDIKRLEGWGYWINWQNVSSS